MFNCTTTWKWKISICIHWITSSLCARRIDAYTDCVKLNTPVKHNNHAYTVWGTFDLCCIHTHEWAKITHKCRYSLSRYFMLIILQLTLSTDVNMLSVSPFCLYRYTAFTTSPHLHNRFGLDPGSWLQPSTNHWIRPRRTDFPQGQHMHKHAAITLSWFIRGIYGQHVSRIDDLRYVYCCVRLTPN